MLSPTQQQRTTRSEAGSDRRPSLTWHRARAHQTGSRTGTGQRSREPQTTPAGSCNSAEPERARAPGRRSPVRRGGTWRRCGERDGRPRGGCRGRAVGRSVSQAGGRRGAGSPPARFSSVCSVALPVQLSRRRSAWGGGAERAALRGAGGHGQRRRGRAMLFMFLPALPFLLLVLLYPLKLLFSAAASTAGNFPEGWASSGLAPRGALQGAGHSARWGEASFGCRAAPARDAPSDERTQFPASAVRLCRLPAFLPAPAGGAAGCARPSRAGSPEGAARARGGREAAGPNGRGVLSPRLGAALRCGGSSEGGGWGGGGASGALLGPGAGLAPRGERGGVLSACGRAGGLAWGPTAAGAGRYGVLRGHSRKIEVPRWTTPVVLSSFLKPALFLWMCSVVSRVLGF